jgi:hypothetical protein
VWGRWHQLQADAIQVAHTLLAALLTFQLLQLLRLLLQLLRLLPHNLAQAANEALAQLPQLLPHIRWRHSCTKRFVSNETFRF